MWLGPTAPLEAALRWMSIVCMFVLLVLVCALVLIRFFPIMSLGWADEIVELAFAWMVFMGTAAVWRSNEHITIDFIPQALVGTRAGRVLEVVVCLLILGFLAVFTWQGWLLHDSGEGQHVAHADDAQAVVVRRDSRVGPGDDRIHRVPYAEGHPAGAPGGEDEWGAVTCERNARP